MSREPHSERVYAVAAGEHTSLVAIRRYFLPSLTALFIALVSFFIYRHLISQAVSQGFVLQELLPLMDLLAECGRSLYWLGGRPLFFPTILTLGAVCWLIVQWSTHKQGRILGYPRLIALALSFSLMYLIGGTQSFPLYIAGIVAAPVLGYAGERNAAEIPTPAGICKKEKGLLAGILLLGLLLRLYEVDVFPRLYMADEQLQAQVTLELGEHPLRFFAEPHIMKPHLLRIGAIRLAFSFLGVGLFQHRTVSIIEGTFTIFLVFLLCRTLWGNRAGIFAAFLTAVDPWQIGHSRIGVHNIEGPLFLTLLMLLIVRVVRLGGIRRILSLGLAAGATVYLYISCLIMAPFAWLAVILGRYFSMKVDKRTLLKEAVLMLGASILIALPYFTFGRKNIGELESFYSAGGSVLDSARDHGWNLIFAGFVNFWYGIEHMITWSSRTVHPSRTFYPNPIAIGFSLIGLGILLKMRKKFEHGLILLWIPLSFLPVTLSYGFAGRRLFATLAPIPALLGGLALSRLWEEISGKGKVVSRRIYQLIIVMLLASLTLVSIFIVFEDADPISGGCPHPRKVAEFIGSLPPQYTVLISNKVKEIPFLVYLQSYDRLKRIDREQALSFVTIEALSGMAEEIATTPGLAVVMDTGQQESLVLEKIKALNPNAEVIKSDAFLACLVH